MAFAAPRPLEAQFGGLRGRITDAAKKAAGADEAPKPADKPTVSKPVVLSTDDPMVIPITDAVLVAFAKGLQTEIDLKEQLRKELAAMKTPEDYAACRQQVAGSPQFMEIMMRLGKLPENPSDEVMQKAMADMARDQEALLSKTCGPDVTQVNSAERLKDIQRKAASAASLK
jgi:hypothetical protein